MLRRKVEQTATVDSVPAELRSRLHPVWLDPSAVQRLCRRLGVDAEGRGPLTRFDAVASAFAVARGLTHVYPSGYTAPSFARMHEAGIPMFSCFLIDREKHPRFFGTDWTMSDNDWEFIAGAEQRVLEQRGGVKNNKALKDRRSR